MEINKETFEDWMKKLSEKLETTDKKLERLLNHQACLNGDELLDNQDLIGMLKVSHRTLQRYRSKGKLPYCNMNGKSFYRLTDVQKFINDQFEGNK
ncbi:MAG: helix-turn-helix domain-containing protein [Paludibacter sp.]|nr:helix-turn-helix domain-containing protein [Paludibacter sp.]